jgi:peptidoglycan-associated lipoprotein
MKLEILAFASIAGAVACGSKPSSGTCHADRDCKAPLVCGENQCVECNTDAQCSDGKHCEAHACIAKSGSDQVDTGPHAKACTKDTDCADDEDCKGGYCARVDQPVANEGCQLNTIYFGFDSSTVDGAERDHLDANNACIGKTTGKNVFVVGHTDTSGTEEYNIALSERRAQAAADYLARLGCDPARLQIVPKGETDPTGLGDDKDRRVEFQWH